MKINISLKVICTIGGLLFIIIQTVVSSPIANEEQDWSSLGAFGEDEMPLAEGHNLDGSLKRVKRWHTFGPRSGPWFGGNPGLPHSAYMGGVDTGEGHGPREFYDDDDDDNDYFDDIYPDYY